ncbi:hypothetical protein AB0L40_03145 [Patulibacter sp. NPDC049589]|uniref:hypothetical protein n=1 Tax=Patulibacter sp. NPDC049589 TaxID=3154731 RepID=UPI0034242754
MATVTQPRPDLDAHRHAMRADVDVVAREVRDLLGARLGAYVAGVGETRALHEWAEGARTPSADAQRRLRLALQIATMIAATDGTQTAQAWFQGLNPQLDDRSPARLIREGALDEVGGQVVAAARAFVVGG